MGLSRRSSASSGWQGGSDDGLGDAGRRRLLGGEPAQGSWMRLRTCSVWWRVHGLRCRCWLMGAGKRFRHCRYKGGPDKGPAALASTHEGGWARDNNRAHPHASGLGLLCLGGRRVGPGAPSATRRHLHAPDPPSLWSSVPQPRARSQPCSGHLHPYCGRMTGARLTIRRGTPRGGADRRPPTAGQRVSPPRGAWLGRCRRAQWGRARGKDRGGLPRRRKPKGGHRRAAPGRRRAASTV